MSKKDQKEINYAIYTIAAYLIRYIDDVNRKLKELLEHVRAEESEDKVKTVTELKKNQEAVSKRFQEFKLHFSESDKLVILTSIDMGVKDLNANFNSYKKIEDYLNGRCNELMIEFVWSQENIKSPKKAEDCLKKFGKSGRKAKEGSSVLLQAYETLKIQKDYESEASKSGRKGEEWVKGEMSDEALVAEMMMRLRQAEPPQTPLVLIQEDLLENKMNEGSDIGGQREDASDLKSSELGAEGIKIQEDYVSKTIKDGKEGEEGGGVLMEGLEIQEHYKKITDGSDIGGQRKDASDLKSSELGAEGIKIQEDYVSKTIKNGKEGEEGGGVLMKGLEIQENYKKINDGSDIGGQREDASDLKSSELGAEGIKMQEDYVSETIKDGREAEEGGGVSMKGLEIQEHYMEKKINDGSDIGGLREDMSDLKSSELGTDGVKIRNDYESETIKGGREGEEGDGVSMKGLEIQIQEEYMGQSLNELALKFDRSDHGSDIHLEKITESGISNDPGACINIEGLKQKICRLISETKWSLEEDKDNEKNSLIDWIKILKATKDRSVELGMELCFLLVDLKYIMSEREELMAKFQVFKSSLDRFFKDVNFMVINKIIEVLEMADGEMRKMDKLKSEREELMAMLQEFKSSLDHFSKDENFMVVNKIIEVLEMADGEMRKMNESKRVLNVSEVKEGLIEVNQIDHLLVSILNEILNLGYVLMHPQLPDLNMSKKDVICSEELKGIDIKIAELKESSTVIFGSEEMKRLEFHTRALHGRVREIWNQFGESLEENEPRID